MISLLSQTIYGAPVTDKSVEDRELDSWVADIEQALDKEVPEGGANIQEEENEGAPGLDRNGELANWEDPTDMEDWEEQEENDIYEDGQNFETNQLPADDDGGRYEQRIDETQMANGMGYPDDVNPQVADDMAVDEELSFIEQSQNSNEQEFWEENEYNHAAVDQQADTHMTDEVQELGNYVDEPSQVPEENWEEHEQQGYYMEMTNEEKLPWKEPSPKDFDDQKFNDDDMKEDPQFDVNKQPVDDRWEEAGPKDFDRLKFDYDDDKKDNPVNKQPVDDPWKETDSKDFDDLKFDSDKYDDMKEDSEFKANKQQIDDIWDEPAGPIYNNDMKVTAEELNANEQEIDNPWKEPSPKDFIDEPQVDDDMEADLNVNQQPVDDLWEEAGPKNFDDSQLDDELNSDDVVNEDLAPDVNSQSNEMEMPVNNKVDEKEKPWEPEYANFDDLGVAEEVTVNLDNTAVESEPWATVSNDTPDDVESEGMTDDQIASINGQFDM